MVINALLSFDVNRLWHIFCIDVEDELVVVLDLTFLTSNFLSSGWVNLKEKIVQNCEYLNSL